MPSTMYTLAGLTAGRYLVRTTSGATYLLDLDSMEFIRTPIDDPELALRRDREVVKLLGLVDCTVGERMVLLIDLEVPLVAYTTRSTTPVVKIDDASLDTDDQIEVGAFEPD